MKVLHICHSDLEGGAARAAFRLHKAQRKQGMDSQMLVINKLSDDPYVHAVSGRRRNWTKITSFFSRLILRAQRTPNTVHHSLNLFPSGLLKDIERISPSVVNLHWLGGEMLSIGELRKISQPIVWTLHDMWAFSGAEHYDDDKPSERYITGYSKESRNPQHKGLDLDKWVYKNKKKTWSKKTIHLVSPSNWLSDCCRASDLFSSMPTKVISNCIDHQTYRPIAQDLAREALGLPLGKRLLLFGAMSSTADPRKGYHLLLPALKHLAERGEAQNIELVVFGASRGDAQDVTGIKTHYMGRLHDDISLCLLYNAADIFVAPSLQDNLPNTLVESLACGTPCVAFDIGGMRDLIVNEKFGFLINEVNTSSLAKAIIDLEDGNAHDKFRISSLSKSIRDETVIAQQYLRLYEDVLKS
ncbi:TPA: glycosyltransferase [Vibrio cholerae]|uniref:glycosyltransferase n=1 Tax=Vibrio TaxID=662 RepID=UPI000DE37D9B|nr:MULTISPECIES: glycosyltransferase [Vibrio]EGR2534769.1 glycosyltransferase [Vibrio cholerae]RBM63631.1 glycosyl transferase [Vibrio paracholerae]TQQ42018.1 glycosyltransferase [Vibrio cholerae]BCK15030.1 Phosphatidyl-myo-inositol mannosyltransferase [Vibrio cholerae]BCN20555.1 putative glycosyltransferase [Vibrio cholerae]